MTEGKGLEIDWADGHKSAWGFAWLRDACPCATCVDERAQQGRKAGQPKPKPAALLPMYAPPPKPASAHAVGRYAIQFNWADGHSGGIYSWEYLRRVCQCQECTFRGGGDDRHAELISELLCGCWNGKVGVVGVYDALPLSARLLLPDLKKFAGIVHGAALA